jgi:hypothetical protein
MKNFAIIVGIAFAAACGGKSKSVETPEVGGAGDIEKKIAENCPADKVGALPTDTPEKQAEWSEMIGKVLSGVLPKADFVSQLSAKNPGSEAAVKCAADQIPDGAAPAPEATPAPTPEPAPAQ